jgi:glycosyltransferase involved in cell wall biosynthesis
LRVVFYYHFLGLGGVESSILNRIEALRYAGIKSEYWFSQLYGSGAQYLTTRDFVHQVDYGTSAFFNELKKVDAIVVIDFPGLIDALEKADIGAPVIFESHASFPPALERYYAALSSKIIKSIVVPSSYNQNLIRNAKVSNLDPVVIPNCIDVRKFSYQAAPVIVDDLKASSGPVILWVGRLEDEKNPLDVFRIAVAMEATNPDVRFLMVGDTPDYHEYIKNSRKLIRRKIPASIRFERQVKFEMMASLYKLAAISGGLLLSTSKFESSPMTFLEAMACRCPILSSNVGGVDNLLQQGKLGVLYRSGNISSAIKEIEQLTNLSCKRKNDRRVERAFEYVKLKHSPSESAGQYKTVLNFVTNSN